MYWELLSSDDQTTYRRICSAITAPSLKNKRNTKIDDFKEMLEAVDLFENHESEEKWKRCLVCGVVKFHGGIAVNISQLKQLVKKCKSSINGSLKGMGYTIISGKASECSELLEIIPNLKGNLGELRQWTVRYLEDSAFTSDREDFVTPPLAINGELTDGATISIGHDTSRHQNDMWDDTKFSSFDEDIVFPF